MRDRRDIRNCSHREPRRLKRANRRLTPRSRALDKYLDLPHAVVQRLACRSFGSYLRSVGCALAGATESMRARARPADDIAYRIGDRDDRVVECRLDIGLPARHIFAFSPPATLRPAGGCTALLLGHDHSTLTRFHSRGKPAGHYRLSLFHI